MAELSQDELQEIVLKNTTENNSLLPSGRHQTIPNLVIASNRYQLDTSKKNVIQAINELLLRTDNYTNIFKAFKERFDIIIGNEDAFVTSGGDREILKELKDTLGVQTLIKMLYKINNKIKFEQIIDNLNVCFLNNEVELDKIIDGLIEYVDGELVDWGKLKEYKLFYVPDN